MQPTPYEYAVLSQQVYENAGGKSPVGWRLVKARYRSDEKAFAVVNYQNDDKRMVVIAFRGTAELRNLWTDINLFYTDFPDTFVYVISHIQETLTSTPSGYVICTTGHSLGAVLAELAACWFGFPATTFESPGSAHIAAANKHLFQSKAPPDITTYLAAPNAINTYNSHLGVLYRLYIPHTDGVSPVHVFWCVLGTAGRLTTYATAGLAVVGASAGFIAAKSTLDAVTTADKATRIAGAATAFATKVQSVVPTMSTLFRPAIGAVAPTAAQAIHGVAETVAMAARFNAAQTVDTLSWIWIVRRQHAIANIVAQFDPESGMPIKAARVKSWPGDDITTRQGKLARMAISLAKSYLPLQLINSGLHNLFDGRSVIEAEIENMDGYSVEKPVTLNIRARL